MNKPILSIETSGENCGACVFFNERKFVEINHNEKNVHSEALLNIIEQALNLVEIQIDEISSVAISMGPGSFTGLRIGLSAAKGLALGKDLPLIPVPTLEAVANTLGQFIPGEQNFFIARKVNISEHYLASFSKSGNEIRTLEQIKLVTNDELMEISKENILFSEKPVSSSLPFPLINASSIAKWAYLFGEELLTYDYDFLEPEYFKKFIPKVKK